MAWMQAFLYDEDLDCWVCTVCGVSLLACLIPGFTQPMISQGRDPVARFVGISFGAPSWPAPPRKTGEIVESFVLVCQIVIALGIFNVWILRVGKSTDYRGGDAKNMKEEFKVYGLPGWFMPVIGTVKLILAAALMVGIWYPVLTTPAAGAMALLMFGALGMHVIVKDPIKKSLPASVMLILSLIVALA